MGYVFEPHALHDVVREAMGSSIQETIPALTDALATRWPDNIDCDHPWVFNNAGGAMGALKVFHASLTEYLIIFGSPIGTEGHTGRFLADDYFYILEGEQWAFAEGDLERSVYRPGEMHHLPRGTARGYRIPESCWALEYARGAIPAMLPFGLADAMFSTLDLRSVARLMSVYGRSVVGQLLRGKI